MFRKSVFTLLLLVSLLIITSCSEDESVSPDYTKDLSEIGINVGETAPGFTLPDMDGKQISLKDYRGKVVLLYFWATWCGTCKYFMPEIKILWDKYKNKDFVVIGLDLDNTKSKWTDYLEDKDFDWIQLFDPRAGWSDSQLHPYGVSSIPRACLLNKYGQILAFDFIGNLDLEELIDSEL